ncbi:aldose 1-epimerase [Arcanobacterium phocae]|uniref:Aldose 1-epimerase n=2 Tax=Arcanobacterium phocae TaxID=131112 RepID=A0A1H2LHN2_9ACTO|nr:aldose 1-epimerase [Arcanobacterium phocae]SDU80547.1 aldose 1-epimerase [Arcanobacterium phocae]
MAVVSMAGTTIEATDFDGLPAWRLTSATGATAVVAERGATLLSWEPRPGFNIVDGYETRAEMEDGRDARSKVMAPWPGRLTGSSYVFDGETYTVNELPEGAAHGLVGEADFTATNTEGALTLTYTFPGSAGYPWTFELSVIFSLDAGADGEEHLTVSFDARHDYPHGIPFAIGWHPYLHFPGSRASNMSLTIPARTRIVFDSHLVPRPGEAAYAGIKAPYQLDFLGSTVLDTSFRGLIPDENGVVTTVLRDPSTNSRIDIVQEPAEAPLVHIYTADGALRNVRGSIAVEPLSHVADAFNRPDAAGSIVLAPGTSRTLTVTLTYHK